MKFNGSECKGENKMKEIVARWKDGQIGASLLSLAIEVDLTKYEDHMECEFPGYCSQNNGKCSTCSLVNYGMDCHNNAINELSESTIKLVNAY